jgi:hypothetical protein
MSAIISFDKPGRLRRPGMAAGIAVSLLLHALLIFGYRQPPETPRPATRTMTVWLTPPPPMKPIVAKVEPPPVSAKSKAPPAPRPRRTPAAAPAAERPAIAAQAITPPAQPAEAPAVTPDPFHPEQQPKQFDMNEALKTARKVAKEKAPAGTLTAQLDAHPINTEPTANELARKMEGAKKTDCLKSASGAGLLAPLFWALDKHCKF